jgi:hypothetical protein
MAKEQIHGLEAERLYVIEQQTLEAIAGRLGVCARTLQNWKARGDWDAKRRAYLASRSSFHEELYEFGKDLLKKIRQDMADDKDIPTGQLYALLRLLPNLVKVKDYEAVTGRSGEEKAATPEETTKNIKDILSTVYGIDFDGNDRPKV